MCRFDRNGKPSDKCLISFQYLLLASTSPVSLCEQHEHISIASGAYQCYGAAICDTPYLPSGNLMFFIHDRAVPCEFAQEPFPPLWSFVFLTHETNECDTCGQLPCFLLSAPRTSSRYAKRISYEVTQMRHSQQEDLTHTHPADIAFNVKVAGFIRDIHPRDKTRKSNI